MEGRPSSMTGRRLAAIMFVDMVGYTRAAQTNEALALRRLAEQRAILRATLGAYGGTEIKTMGDGSLVQFASALDAVKGAIAVQTRLRERNSTGPEAGPIVLRIGIHAGEVVETSGDILGDAVNVAARIEPLAEPGGICVSDAVAQMVRASLPAPLKSAGRVSLKNVELPLEVFRVVLESGASAAEPATAGAPEAGAWVRPQRVAVLPLSNLSATPEDYFADGLTEELISTVGRASGLRVISRTSAEKARASGKTLPEIGRDLRVGSVLEGSVRRTEGRVRVSVQLIDVATDEQLWSQRYDRELKDVFAIQSDIAERVADALRVQLRPDEREGIERRPTDDARAHDLYLQGRFLWHKGTEEDLREAIRRFERAIAVDPAYSLAYVGLADCYIGLCDEGCLDPDATYAKVRPLVERALALDDQLPEAHATMARLEQDYLRDWAGAEARFRRAIELNPNWSVVCHSYAVHLALRGRFEQALNEISRAEELDPYSLGIHNCAAEIYRDADRSEESIQQCRQMLEIDPASVPAYTKLGKAFLQMGRLAEGIEAMEKAVELSHGGLLATSYLAYAYGVVGRTDDARRLIRQLEGAADGRYISPYNLAIAYAGLRDREATLAWLRRAYETKSSAVAGIRVDRIFGFLRGDPDFRELERSLGLLSDAAPPASSLPAGADTPMARVT
jgi:adenylate cyclase